jgi:hypothetical protein
VTVATAQRPPRLRPEQDLHVPSHRRLVDSRRSRWSRTFDQYPDVVVVPAARAKGTVRHAAGVARMAQCPLVIIASKDLTAQEVITELKGAALPPTVLAVNLDDWNAMSSLNLVTSRFNAVTDARCDTSDKRNLAILAARRIGWDRILFLDDDVSGLGRRELDTMAALMGQQVTDGREVQAVGWAFTASNENSTDDNSVVCHAYRGTGATQDTFIGAGGLMIRCGAETPFFPKVYNEDWLFLLPLLASGTVMLAGHLSQNAFDPFADPRRAQREEFGDVLAESLYTLLHHAKDEATRPMDIIWEAGKDSHWWTTMVDRRRRFIDHIQGRFRANRSTRQEIVDALGAARSTLRNSWSDLLAEYVQSWEIDFGTWHKELAVGAIDDTAAHLIENHEIEGIFKDLGMSGAEWLHAPETAFAPNDRRDVQKPLLTH